MTAFSWQCRHSISTTIPRHSLAGSRLSAVAYGISFAFPQAHKSGILQGSFQETGQLFRYAYPDWLQKTHIDPCSVRRYARKMRVSYCKKTGRRQRIAVHAYSLVTTFDNVPVLTLQRQQEMGPRGLHLLLDCLPSRRCTCGKVTIFYCKEWRGDVYSIRFFCQERPQSINQPAYFCKYGCGNAKKKLGLAR